jgi:hypothetical protein
MSDYRNGGVRLGSRDEGILAQRAKDKAARREFHRKKRERPKNADEIKKASQKATETKLRVQAREILRSQNSVEAASQPVAARFVSRSDATQERLVSETVGFISGSDFVQKRKEIEHEEKRKRKKETKRAKLRNKPQLQRLSFGADEEDHEEQQNQQQSVVKSLKPKVTASAAAQKAVQTKEGSSEAQANMDAAKKLRAALLQS